MPIKLWGITANTFTETIRQPIYGVIILVTILYMPRGIVAYAQRKNWPLVPVASPEVAVM